MSNQNIINPKACNYGCGTRIFWDTSQNAYLEVFTKKKHICLIGRAISQRLIQQQQISTMSRRLQTTKTQNV